MTAVGGGEIIADQPTGIRVCLTTIAEQRVRAIFVCRRSYDGIHVSPVDWRTKDAGNLQNRLLVQTVTRQLSIQWSVSKDPYWQWHMDVTFSV